MPDIYRDLKISTIVEATEDFPRHSEASVLELKDGSLLMAWQSHEKSAIGANDSAPGTISLMNSHDNGESWTDRRVVAKMIEGCVNCYSPSLLRRADGSVSLFFRRYTHLAPLEERRSSLYRIDSFDEGESWSGEYTLLEDQALTPMNDTFKRLRDGSVLMPVTFSTGGWCSTDERSHIQVLRSQDDCKTWSESNVITLPMRGAMEPCVAQRADGSLNMVMRTQLGSVFFSESFDGGKTWSKPQTTGLRAPESCPCIVSLPGTDAQLVVWNNAEYDMSWRSHYGKRTPLTMAISRDGLKTFSHFFDLETDPGRGFTNPAVTVTSTGLCVLNYWTRPYLPNGRMGGYIDLKLATFRVEL